MISISNKNYILRLLKLNITNAYLLQSCFFRIGLIFVGNSTRLKSNVIGPFFSVETNLKLF